MKNFVCSPQLIAKAEEIYDSLPAYYSVPTDVIDGKAHRWMQVPNGPGEAAFDALEDAGLEVTVKSITVLRTALEMQLANRRMP